MKHLFHTSSYYNSLTAALLLVFLLAGCGLNGAQDSATLPASEESAQALATRDQAPLSPLETGSAVTGPLPATTDSAAGESAQQDATTLEPAPAASSISAPPSGLPLDLTARIPREIGRLALTSSGNRLADFRLDADGATAYLTSYDQTSGAGYHLYVVDTSTMQPLADFAVSGDRLTYDALNSRLYIAADTPTAAGGEVAKVTVFDTAARQIVGEVPGSRVAVDPQRNRLYVGDVVDPLETSAPGVRLYDASTLELIREGALAGDPLYNPARDELIVANYSAFIADPESLTKRADLFPDISGQPLRACNGCSTITDAFYFPTEDLLLFDESIISPGKGAGIYPPQRALDAATLEPSTLPYALSATCASQPALRSLVDGRMLVHDFYSRYMVYNNLSVHDGTGGVVAARDGLRGPFENVATHTAYVQDSDAATWVLDRDTLDLISVIPSYCFFSRDTSGQLYATDADRRDLIKLEEAGGTSLARPPTPAQLAGDSVLEVLVSPAWTQDNTLFLRVSQADGNGQALLRSTDAGATWTRLDGLPAGGGGASFGDSLVVALSPAFASDGTLFAAGAHGDADGLGVWRSTDRGGTWQPLWHGLEDLRVNRLDISPRFAVDQTLLAYAPYTRIRPWESGVSIQKSTDGGLNWTRVITAEYVDLLPAPSVYLPITQTLDLPVRKRGYFEPVEVRLDGSTWATATGAIGAETMAVGVVTAPGNGASADIFVITEDAVYRTQDGGASWQAWQDPRLETIDLETAITAGSLTPPAADGSYKLMLGTANGNLWQVDPAEMNWVAVTQASTDAPVTVITETVPLTIAATPALEREAPVTQAVTAVATPQPEVAAAALGATPPAGLYIPGGIAGDRWKNDPALQQALGYARTEQAQSVSAAYQPFERGAMIWRGDTHEILVIYADKTWDVFADTFKEGELERDPNLYTPGELLQPERGFGKIWRGDPALQERIGWATAREKGETALIHAFERGFVVWAGSRVIVLIEGPEGRTWR